MSNSYYHLSCSTVLNSVMRSGECEEPLQPQKVQRVTSSLLSVLFRRFQLGRHLGSRIVPSPTITPSFSCRRLNDPNQVDQLNFHDSRFCWVSLTFDKSCSEDSTCHLRTWFRDSVTRTNSRHHMSWKQKTGRYVPRLLVALLHLLMCVFHVVCTQVNACAPV